MKGFDDLNILSIINDKDINDIPILYILRVVNAIQKELEDEQSCYFCNELSENNKQIKE